MPHRSVQTRVRTRASTLNEVGKHLGFEQRRNLAAVLRTKCVGWGRGEGGNRGPVKGLL